MQILKSTILLSITLLATNEILSQCPPGQSSVQIIIETDYWGEEVYWELVPQGQICGEEAVVLSGGNPSVGCAGNPGSIYDEITYFSSSIYLSEIACVTSGTQVDLIHVDSWGDGGTDFTVLNEGFFVAYLDGTGLGDTWTIDVQEYLLVDHDSSCDAAEILTDGTPIVISNEGATAEFYEIGAPAIGCSMPGGWCESGVTNSVWAKFIADEEVVYKVNSCNPGTYFDTQIAAWLVDDCGNWESYSLIGANDDSQCGLSNYYSSTCFISCVPVGTEVYIQVDGWNGSVGEVELTVEASDSNIEVEAIVHNITCALETEFNPDGTITVYVNNGGLEWDADWTGPFGYTGSGLSINGLLPGVYNVSVTSECSGDVFHESFTIINPEPLELEVEITSSCNIEEAGSIDLTISGGTGDLDVMWEGPEGGIWLSQDIYSAQAGLYYVQVVDGNGCSEDLDVEVTFMGIMPFDLGVDFEMCSGETDFFFGPMGNYSYQWMDGSTGSFYILETEEGVSTTSVVGVTVSNYYGCEVTDAVVITIMNCDLATSDVEGGGNWSISPNPISGYSILKLDGVGDNSKCIVRDASGRIVEVFAVSPVTYFDASDLRPGVYMIEIQDVKGRSVWHSRAVIQ